MKHLKLFENYSREHDTATLRDVVDPTTFSEEFADYYQDVANAAFWTCKTLGIELGAGAARLQALGLTDTAGILERLPLERVVEVYNTLVEKIFSLETTTWHAMPRFKELVRALPGLFALDEHGDLVQADSAQSIASENFGSIGVEVWLDPQSGARAVCWGGQRVLKAFYMLDSDLVTAAR